MKTNQTATPKRVRRSLSGNDVVEQFEKLEIQQDELPTYKNAEQFARQFQRCDLQEYAHTKYAVNTCCDE